MILKIGEFVEKINDYKNKVKPSALFLQNICVLSTIRLLDSNEILQQNIKSYTDKISGIADINIDKFILYVSDSILRIYAQEVDLSYSDCDSIENDIFDVATDLNALEKNIYIIITTFIYNYIVENTSALETKFNSLFETIDSQSENISQELNESNDETESENLLQKLNKLNIYNDLKLLYKIYYVLMTDEDTMTNLLHDVFDSSLDTFYNKILPSNIVNVNISPIFISDLDSIIVTFKFKIDYLSNTFDKNNITTELTNIFSNELKASRQSTKPKSSTLSNYKKRATDFETYNQFFDMDHTSVMNRYCVNCSDCSSCLCCYNCSKCFMCSYCTFTTKSTMSMFVNRSTHINHCYGVDNGAVNQYCNNVESCENCTRLNNAKKCYNVRDSAWLDNVESYKHVYGTITRYLTPNDIHNSTIYTNSNMLIEDDGKTIKSATKVSISEYEYLKHSSMIERRTCLV